MLPLTSGGIILYEKKDISPVPKISVFPSVRPFLLGYRRVANTIAWSAFKPVAAGLQSAAPPPVCHLPSALTPQPQIRYHANLSACLLLLWRLPSRRYHLFMVFNASLPGLLCWPFSPSDPQLKGFMLFCWQCVWNLWLVSMVNSGLQFFFTLLHFNQLGLFPLKALCIWNNVSGCAWFHF